MGLEYSKRIQQEKQGKSGEPVEFVFQIGARARIV